MANDSNQEAVFAFYSEGRWLFLQGRLGEKWIHPPRADELALDDPDQVSDLSVPASQIIETFTIITTEPNPMAPPSAPGCR